MNLIEQLGGYEKARQYAKNYHSIDFDISSFDRLLLQYRREHNIFEVGDKVIRLDVDNIFIYTVQKVTLDLITVVRKKKSNAVKTWGMWLGNNELRHATPEEIQAGRRLSKIKCWSCDKEMSHSDRAENDGFCIHCNAEIEL